MASVKTQEMRLLLSITGGIYRQPAVAAPEAVAVNWEAFFRLARQNKLLYPALNGIMASEKYAAEPSAREMATALLKTEEANLARFGRTLSKVQEVMGAEPYALFKTYLSYPYVAEDVDLMVNNPEQAAGLFRAAGIEPETWWNNNNYRIRTKDMAEIELYDRVSPGRMLFMDKSLVLTGSRQASIGGADAPLPSAEADVMTYLADAGFRTYELPLGEILYLFIMAEQVDWGKVIEQAKKHHWLGSLKRTAAVLNGLHRELYNAPGPLENVFPAVSRRKFSLPLVMSCGHFSQIFRKNKTQYFIKIPGYLSVRMRYSCPRLHRVYTRLIMDYVGNSFGKIIYRRAGKTAQL